MQRSYGTPHQCSPKSAAPAKASSILIIEPDDDLRRQLSYFLTNECGWQTDQTSSLSDALAMLEARQFDAVVLGISSELTAKQKVGQAEAIRERSDVILLVIPSGCEWKDYVNFIDAGADRVLAKPFHVEVLAANLRALSRLATLNPRKPVYPITDRVSADFEQEGVMVDGKRVNTITRSQWDLVKRFVLHRGKTVLREDLIYAMDSSSESNCVEVQIRRLRRNLGTALGEDQSNIHTGIIRTVWGEGYKIPPYEELVRSSPSSRQAARVQPPGVF